MLIKTVVVLLTFLAGSMGGNPKVCLDNGACYIGSWYQTRNGVKFASFQGIRYAVSPTQTLRFRRPISHEPEANKTYNVSHESKVMCPQLNVLSPNFEYIGQEDCLILNVYIPEVIYRTPGSKADVMVWIYGGGLATGTNAYGLFGKYIFVANVIRHNK